jgi:hypothetical protein
VNDDYGDIVEVAEYHMARANQCLEAGYRLLRIATTSHQREKRDNSNQVYISHEFQYVVGRTAEVPHFEPQMRTP